MAVEAFAEHSRYGARFDGSTDGPASRRVPSGYEEIELTIVTEAGFYKGTFLVAQGSLTVASEDSTTGKVIRVSSTPKKLEIGYVQLV